MYKVLFGLLLSGFSLPLSTLAQTDADTLTYFPSDRIQGGAPTFYQILSDYLVYPASARYRKVVGTAIVAITVPSRGQLTQVDIINSLGNSFDRTIQSAVNRTKGLWLIDELVKNDIIVFVPIIFLFDGTEILQDIDKPPFLVPAAKIIIDTFGREMNLESDAEVAQRANQSYQQKDYKATIKYVDELIRRNPYRKSFYLMRGNAYYQLGDHERGCADFAKITDFLKERLPHVVVKLCGNNR